jgi:hypothetical protein
MPCKFNTFVFANLKDLGIFAPLKKKAIENQNKHIEKTVVAFGNFYFFGCRRGFI